MTQTLTILDCGHPPTPRLTIPLEFEVQPLAHGQVGIDPVTCGECGLTWDDGISTSWTPTPSGRCPFEWLHDKVSIGTGIAYMGDRTWCYPCADAKQRADIELFPEVAWAGYLSGDGRTVTTWTGGELARVIYRTKTKQGIHCVRARTPNGTEWFGRCGGPGVLLVLRPAKANR